VNTEKENPQLHEVLKIDGDEVVPQITYEERVKLKESRGHWPSKEEIDEYLSSRPKKREA